MQRAPEGPEGKLRREVSLEHLDHDAGAGVCGWKKTQSTSKTIPVVLQGGKASPAQGRQKAEPEGKSAAALPEGTTSGKLKGKTLQTHLASGKYKGFNHHLRTKSEPSHWGQVTQQKAP